MRMVMNLLRVFSQNVVYAADKHNSFGNGRDKPHVQPKVVLVHMRM